MTNHSYKLHNSLWYRLLLIGVILAMAFGSQTTLVTMNAQALSAPAPLAATNTLQLSVISATDATPITNFKYIINIDNTGTTNQRSPSDGCNPDAPGYPGSCQWVSVAGAMSNSPIFTQGDQSDFGGGINLPAGRYLVSVLADGYKIDGEHFTVPINGSVTVKMQPYNLPDATVQAEVFEDVAPTNSAPDVPAERGLAGFVGHIKDYIDEVTTDVYGAPLCGNSHCVSACYVVDGGVDIGTVAPLDSFGRCPIAFDPADDPMLGSPITQTLEGVPIPIGAVVEGKVIIPNLGPNRYALSVVPPNNSGWVQTTTLEGNHDWDAWVMEGSTGLDTEFVVAGEPFPATFFGFVRPSTNTMAAGSGEIKGLAVAVSAYIPPTGGITGELGLLGAKPKDKNPIHSLYVSLSDLNNSDQTVYTGHFVCDEGAGCPAIPFDITGVPDGDYVIGIWDEPQDYIFQVQNVSVRNGELVDMGSISLMGWWTTIEGHVFNDLNEDGHMDPGEPGIPNFFISMRMRENATMDRGTASVTTDAAGYYWMESAYPMTRWLVEEAYADGFQTTGITYQADNQPQETTVLGQGVDVNVFPVIGLGGRLDWGVKAYAPNTNGGIVGTVSYDTTRNELDPSYAAIEDWQPSIPNLTVDLYAPVDCPNDDVTPCDANGFYQLEPDGSYSKGQLLNQYLTESWERPSGCVARNVNGDALIHGVDEKVLPLNPDAPCLEGPLMGVQFGPMSDGTNFGASVDGNYGFGDGCYLADGVTPGLFDPGTGDCSAGTLQSLPSNRDYLVKVNIPTEGDVHGIAAVHPDKPLYQVTREEDINIANGDSFIPQVPPPSCAGVLHTVDVAGSGTDSYGAVVGAGYDINGVAVGVTVPVSTPTDNPTFVDIGGTVYEGQPKPLCDTKLVHLSDRKSIAPGFNLFTDVPLPGRFWGLLVDDLNFSSNPQSLGYGEKMGISFAPVGVYDYTNRLITTVESDYNGLFDVLLPSTNRISCPTPSGVCANLYRFVGNDPGIPGGWNANFNPQFRTISAEFEAFPGLTIPADLAPTQVAVAVQIPGAQTLSAVACTLNATQPQLLAVSKPYANTSGSDTFTIDGFGFGGTTGQVLLDSVALPTTSWNYGHIAVTVPSTAAVGVHQLSIKASNGMSTVNGLTFHVFGSGTVSVSPFPVNATALDTFSNRNSLGGNWNSNGGGFDVVNNAGTTNDFLRIRSGNNISNAWWTAGSALGTSQEAYFTFIRPSGRIQANEQGLLLKYSGGSNPSSNSARWIEVSLDNNNQADPEGVSVRVRTKLSNTTITDQLEITGSAAVFSAGDQLGARAMSNGDIIVYKNASEIGRVNVGATSSMTGRIGIRFEDTGSSSATEARIDNFGGGNVTSLVTNAGSQPSLFEVGPGHPYGSIQSAIDAAAAQNPYKDSLVVVYPGATSNNPRYNGRGAYYENPIMYAPVQLQGIGPGGVRPDNSIVQGSIIDGSAFGGDKAVALNWLGKVSTLTWDGNQDINDGQVIYVLASDSGSPNINRAGSFGSTFKASIDGFDIRGGDQQGIPGNLRAIFGGEAAGLPETVVTQGGAIFVNSYARNLQITNNVVESNGGSYGAIRIGTPSIPGTGADQQNDNVRIANNRILANGGTNLAGAIGVFNGAENYEIAGNDLCGNFSAEYGGGISHFGFSPNGKIHDNRIYFNRSYDEGAGIMIAGELPANPAANYGTANGAKGSGPVDIFNNLIQANLSDDDGGGLRFLMAGNFPMNVYNNMIVNNVSTHEGGGVALDDAPNVRFYNNTVMKNTTTATAITSNGLPAPAGLSTGQNSAQLQATLPGGSPTFSNPLLFNNIFRDNRAGTRGINTVTGIGNGDANPWDLGSLDLSILLSPTNSIIQQAYPYTSSPTNSAADPTVVAPLNIPLTFTSWRTNVNFIGAIMVTADLSPNLMGNYHLLNNSSPAHDSAAASKAVPSYQQPPAPNLAAPTIDIDNQTRPIDSGFDMGADEFGVAVAPPPPPPPTTQLYLSLTDNDTLPGASGTLSVADEDIVLFNGTNYSMVFDGSDVLPSGTDVDAFAIVDATTIRLSFADLISSGSLSGIPNSFGAIDDSDIVTFTGTLGSSTSGTFSVYFDGSDVGLSDGSEDVDAVELISDGSLVVSTTGNFTVTGASGNEQDLLRCVGSFGTTTTCTWTLYFDGSDVGLSGENVDAVAVTSDGKIYLSTEGSFSVTGVSGADEDVFVFTPSSLGSTTVGTYSPTLYFNGSDFSLGGNDVDAIDLP